MTLISSTLQRLFPLGRDIFVRFPITMTCGFLFGVIAVTANHRIYLLGNDDVTVRMLILLVFIALLALIFKRIVERQSGWLKSHIAGLVILPTAVAWQLFATEDLWFYSTLLLGGVSLLLMAAPFINRHSDNQTFCYFNYTLAMSTSFALLATLVLCLGAVACLASIEYLFDIKIASRLYSDIWLIGACFFAPFYILSRVHESADLSKHMIATPKGISFVITYILLPLMFLYFLILYAYGLKILIQWDLPRGNLTYMVTAFGAIGIATHMFATPLYQSGHRWLDAFYRYFYFILLAPVILLIVGIGVRVNEYGITENRYIIMVAVVWFLLTAGYFFTSRVSQVKMPAIFLAVLLLLAGNGPWGAVNISTHSQLGRLQDLLIEQNMLVNDRILPAKDALDFKESQSITSLVEYFVRKKRLYVLRPWFADMENAYLNIHQGSPFNTKEILKDIGVKYIRPGQKQQNWMPFYFQLPYGPFEDSSATKSVAKSVNIAGFTHAVQFNGIHPDSTGHWSKVVHRNLDKYLFDFTDGALTVSHSGKTTVAVFDIHSMIKILRKSNHSNRLPDDKSSLLVLDADSDSPARVYITKVDGSTQGEKIKVSRLEFLILF